MRRKQRGFLLNPFRFGGGGGGGTPATPYRYWRMYVTAVDGSTSYVSLGEIEMFESSDATGTDVTSGKTFSQSGDGAVGAAGNGADDNIGTEAGSSLPLPYWWELDLGAGNDKALKSMSLRAQRVVPDRTPKDFVLQGSADRATWADVVTVTGASGWAEYERRTFPDRPTTPGSYRYMRLQIIRWASGGSVGTSGDTRVSELQFYEAGEAGDIRFPQGGTASASSSNGSFPPSNAFDGVTGDTSRWISGSGGGEQWLQIDMGSGEGCLPYKFAIAPDGAVGSGYYIVEFKLYGSSTGAFAGEETQLYHGNDLVQADWTASTLKNFTI